MSIVQLSVEHWKSCRRVPFREMVRVGLNHVAQMQHLKKWELSSKQTKQVKCWQINFTFAAAWKKKKVLFSAWSTGVWWFVFISVFLIMINQFGTGDFPLWVAPKIPLFRKKTCTVQHYIWLVWQQLLETKSKS